MLVWPLHARHVFRAHVGQLLMQSAHRGGGPRGDALPPPAAGAGHKPDGHLLDHLVCPLKERRRDRQAEGFGGLEVDDQLELGGLLDGQVGRLGAL